MFCALKAEDIELETEVDQALHEHGNNAREAIKALLVANAYLEAARDEALGMVSRGFIRSALKPQQRGGQ
jgi:hypothetical protein